MKLLAIVVLVVTLHAESVTWTQQSSGGTYPGAVGFIDIKDDPTSSCIIYPGKLLASTTIYSTDLYCYKPALNTFTRHSGLGTLENACTHDDSALPGERHYASQWAIDRVHSKLYMYGGLNTACNPTFTSNGTTTITLTTYITSSNWAGKSITLGGLGTRTISSITDATHFVVNAAVTAGSGSISFPTPDVNPKGSMYRMSLTSGFTGNSWAQLTPSHMPTPNNNATLAHDSTNNVLVLWGTDGAANNGNLWVYCDTSANPTPGTLTANQSSAGCNTNGADDWSPIDYGGAACIIAGDCPSGVAYPGVAYDPISGKILMYGGSNSANGVWYNDLFQYDVLNKAFTKRCVACTKPPVYSGGNTGRPPMAIDPATGNLYYHQTSGTGSPRTWMYNDTSEAWTVIGSGGPSIEANMAYDTATGSLVAYTNSAGIIMWTGAVSGAPVTGQFRSLGTWPSGNLKWVKACGLASSVSAGGTATVNVTGAGTIALTVQEMIFHGSTSGVARTDEPFCLGVPIPDSTALSSVSGLSLTGSVTTVSDIDMATDGSTITVDTGTGGCVFTVKKANYNVLDTVVCGGTTVVATSSSATRGLVITGPDPTAGTTTGKVTCSGDTGGSACATVYSSANDSAATCSIEENGPIVSVLKCAGTHKDASANPYMQYTQRLFFYRGKRGVKIETTLRNSNYSTAATPSADCNNVSGSCTGGTFNTAWKAVKSYELRLAANITGTLNYTIANDTGTPLTGTLDQSGGTDTAWIYQGASEWMRPVSSSGYNCGIGSECASYFTTDAGWNAKKNSTTLDTGTQTEYPAGYADIANSSGVGIEIGMHQFAAAWPASLEFAGGGAEARIGLFSAKNSRNAVYQPWPSSSTREVYLIFHTANPSSLPNEHLKMQHPLIARASRAHYNTTGVFPYQIVDPTEEDAFYAGLSAQTNPTVSNDKFCYGGGSTECAPDRSASDATRISKALAIGMYRAYVWADGGSLNQEEFRWSDLVTKWLQRGHTGRYVNAHNWYRFFLRDRGLIPHSDGTSSSDATINGFTWRSRPHVGASPAEVGLFGFPAGCRYSDEVANPCASTINSDKATMSWSFGDPLHAHWYGMPDYYFMTGDEAIKDALVPVKDYYLNPDTYQGTGHESHNGWPTRAVGVYLMGASRFAEYLKAIGETTDAADVLAAATEMFDRQVKTEGCLNGYPSGCTAPVTNSYPSFPDDEVAGISRKRGIHQSRSFRGTSFCGANNVAYRAQAGFQSSILIEGMLSLRRAKTSSWNDYKLALDLAYGVSQWGLTENYPDNGSSIWYAGGGTNGESLYNGFRFGVQIDHAHTCGTDTPIAFETTSIDGTTYMTVSTADAWQAVWFHFYTQYLVNGTITTDQQRKLRHALSWVGQRQSVFPADFGGYQLGAIIDAINHPTGATLQDVAFSVSHLGGGDYRLSWTVPSGAQSYRIKWSPLNIAPSTALLNFDALGYSFGTNPATNDTWFGATNVTEPSVAGAGSTQTFDVTGTGSTTLSMGNFSLKAYATDLIVGASSFRVPSGRIVGKTLIK